MKKQPDYNTETLRGLDCIYFKRIEAMEFVIKYDDAKDYSGILYEFMKTVTNLKLILNDMFFIII